MSSAEGDHPRLRVEPTTPGLPIGTVQLTAVLTVGMGIGTILPFAIAALGPLVIGELGLTRSQFGGLLTTLFVAATLLSPVSGRVVDRFGGRTVGVALVVSSACAWVGFSLGPTYGILVLAAVVGGLPQSLSNPVTNRLLWLHGRADRRGVLLGIKQSGVQIGTALAALAPLGAAIVGWRSVLRLAALVPLVCVVWFWWVLPAESSPDGRTGTSVPRAAGGRGLQILPWMTAYAFFMGAGLAALISYLPLYGFERLSMDAGTAALPAGVLGVMGGVARISWGVASDRLRRTSGALVVIGVGSALGTLAVLLADGRGASWLWAGAVVAGLTAPAWNAVAMYEVATAVGSERLGWASGVVFAGLFAGFSVAPVSLGLLVDRTGSYDVGWTCVLGAFLVGTAVAVGWWRRSAQGSAEAP